MLNYPSLPFLLEFTLQLVFFNRLFQRLLEVDNLIRQLGRISLLIVPLVLFDVVLEGIRPKWRITTNGPVAELAPMRAEAADFKAATAAFRALPKRVSMAGRPVDDLTGLLGRVQFLFRSLVLVHLPILSG